MDKFSDRRSYGDEAEDELYKYCDQHSIKYIIIVSREEWADVEKYTAEWVALVKKDLEEGDVIFPIIHENVDVKHNSITLHSLDNFKHTYYIVYNNFLNKVIVLKKDDVNTLDRNLAEELRSEDKGFKFRILETLPHLTLEEFFKVEKIAFKVPTYYPKNSLSTEKAEDNIVLHFSDDSTTKVTWKIQTSIEAYIRGVNRKSTGKYVIGYTKNGVYFDA
jgi:hypothetical protein